jgi:hypothetical protein
LNYGIGNLSGILGIDTVTLGENSQLIKIPQTTFGQANKLSIHFAPVPIDGVFGLGFQIITTILINDFFAERSSG